MKRIKIPKQAEITKILILEGKLARSHLLSLLFSEIFNGLVENKNYSLTELSDKIKRSRPQTFNLLRELLISEVITRVKRQNKFIYIPTEKIKEGELYIIAKRIVEVEK